MGEFQDAVDIGNVHLLAVEDGNTVLAQLADNT
jgi:hypothetical protein